MRCLLRKQRLANRRYTYFTDSFLEHLGKSLLSHVHLNIGTRPSEVNCSLGHVCLSSCLFFPARTWKIKEHS